MLPPGGPEKLDWLRCGQANLHLRQSPQWQTPRFPHGCLKTFGSPIYSHYDWTMIGWAEQVGCTGNQMLGRSPIQTVFLDGCVGTTMCQPMWSGDMT